MNQIIPLVRQHWLSIGSILISIFFIYSSGAYWLSTSSLTKVAHINITKIKQIKSSEKPLNYYPLFGDNTSLNPHNKKIPVTILNLSLIGILKSSDPAQSQALIKISDDVEKLFIINDKISENTYLYKILNEDVLLKRNNVIEKLSLPKEQLDTTNNQAELEE